MPRLFVTVLVSALCLAMLGLSACNETEKKEAAPAAPAAQGAGAQPAAKAALNLAVVDSDRIYQESAMGVAANNILKDMNQKLQAEMMAFQEAKKDTATDADAELYRKATGAYREIMQAAVEQMEQQVQARVFEVLSNFRQQHDLALILKKEQVLSYGMEVDVTEEVLKAMDATPLDLKAPEVKDEHNLFPPDALAPATDAGNASNASQ